MSDEFGNFIEDKKERQSSKFRKTEFLTLDEGEHVVRILDGHEVKHYIHYINFMYLACLGDECPLCQNNKKIMYEHPEDFRDVKGWYPRRDRYYINVLDRTPVKVCEKCQTVNKAQGEVCSGCGTALGTVRPLDEVKVLSGSERLFTDLKVISNSVRDEDDKRVDIRSYDWMILVRGVKRDKVTTPTPRYFPNKAGLIELKEGQELYDLEKATIKLEPEEMLEVFNGHSLKDVFAIRKAKTDAKTAIFNSDMELTDNPAQDIDDAAQSLFNF